MYILNTALRLSAFVCGVLCGANRAALCGTIYALQLPLRTCEISFASVGRRASVTNRTAVVTGVLVVPKKTLATGIIADSTFAPKSVPPATFDLLFRVTSSLICFHTSLCIRTCNDSIHRKHSSNSWSFNTDETAECSRYDAMPRYLSLQYGSDGEKSVYQPKNECWLPP